jgi:hypothetical protein
MKVKVAKLRGRPAKPSAELSQVEVIASLGLTDAEIAVVLRVSERTLNYWKKDTEFLQSLKRGKIKADFKVTQSLYQKAIGYKAVDKHGNQIDVPGDTTAMIFWLKNRQPDRWRDKHELDVPGVEKALYEISEKFLPQVQRGHAKK